MWFPPGRKVRFRRRESRRAGKVLINLATGLEDDARVTVAFLLATAALGQGKQVLRPICLNARGLADHEKVGNAKAAGTTPMCEWVGDDTTIFSN
jgi:hypothetical protein